ncbi:MAG TPA: histidine phosphatase family protein [Candidatus Blautia faecipullorum]|mgnify:CR=1 FL=1|nr:histidine phosphatase family protein [Candidatus Blautia faecipullorum]
MRILFVRHGDPDYEHDTLTEKGHREAALLGKLAPALDMGECFMSPLGRARHTAEYCLKSTGKQARVLEWLREFPAEVDINHSPELQEAYPDCRKEGDRYALRIPWDMVPGYLSSHPEYMSREGWRNSEAARRSDMEAVYDGLTDKLDELLAEYGYVREGDHYRVEKECKKTLTFFCHFGVTCAMLAHLWNVSPFILWHSLALLPTSFTEVVTEERQKGTAYFRALHVGDTSHLRLGGEEPSFACRFCEVYSDPERH